MILAAPMFLRVVTTPFLTAYADRASDRANVLLLLVAAALVSVLRVFPAAGLRHRAGRLAGAVRRVDAASAAGRFAGAVGRAAVRLELHQHAHLGFDLVPRAPISVGGMILSWTSPQAVPVIMTASLGVGLLTVLMAPRLGSPRRASPLSVEGLQDAPKLLNRYFVLFVTGAGVINGSHGFMYGFASIYWKSIGLGDTLMGFLWAFAVVSEVVRLPGFHACFRPVSGDHAADDCRASPRSCAGSPIRWSGRSGWACRASSRVQALHGLSTGIMLIGVQKLIAEIGRRRADRRCPGRCLLCDGNLHGDRDLAVRPALRPLRRAGLLRDDRRCAGRAWCWSSFRPPQPQSAGVGR